MSSSKNKQSSGEKARQTQGKAAATNAGWCQLSECRLLQKIIQFKPVGLNAKFNLNFLHHYMNTIEETEEDTNFEDYLSEKDFETLKKRRQEGKVDLKNPMTFQPHYAIRPTVEQILQKLGEYYDLELLRENELIPEAMEKMRDMSIDFK